MRQLMLALVCSVVVAGPAAAQAPDLTGRWNLTVTAPEAVYPAVLEAKQAGEKITGTITGGPGQYPVTGTRTADGLSLSFTITRDDGPMLITLKGTQTGNALKGTATFGADAEGTWSGTRATATADAAPAPAAGAAPGTADSFTGTWALDVTTGAGSGTPTVTLKQDGAALTGTYSGQLGEAPVKGRITGQDFTFAFDVTVQDVALHVVYSGRLSGTTMSGKVSLGDLGEGSFTGTKK